MYYIRINARENEAPKVQMPRWNDTISQTQLSTIPQTQQLQMHVYCTAITMQCFSYATRSQSVLTTIQMGVSTVFSTAEHSTRIPRAR